MYVSEGKDADAVNVLQTVAEKACQQHGTRVLNVFRDDEYNRTGFTLGVGVASVAGHATPVCRTAEAKRAGADRAGAENHRS